MPFNNGVVGAVSEDGTEFGLDHVQKAFNQCAKAHEPDLAAYIAEAARAHAAAGRFSDDVCVLLSRLHTADTLHAATQPAPKDSIDVRSALKVRGKSLSPQRMYAPCAPRAMSPARNVTGLSPQEVNIQPIKQSNLAHHAYEGICWTRRKIVRGKQT